MSDSNCVNAFARCSLQVGRSVRGLWGLRSQQLRAQSGPTLRELPWSLVDCLQQLSVEPQFSSTDGVQQSSASMSMALAAAGHEIPLQSRGGSVTGVQLPSEQLSIRWLEGSQQPSAQSSSLGGAEEVQQPSSLLALPPALQVTGLQLSQPEAAIMLWLIAAGLQCLSTPEELPSQLARL